MGSVRVRPARPEDRRAIAEVHVGTWQVAYRGIVPDVYLDSLDVTKRAASYNEDFLTDPLRPVWVADVSRVVGFASAGPSRDEEGNGELYAIYVDPSQWGAGAGAALMEIVLDHLRLRFPAATLWVIEQNDRARRFYEKYGWSFDGTTLDDDSRGFTLNEVRYRIDLK